MRRRRVALWFVRESYYWEAMHAGRARPFIRIREWLLDRYVLRNTR